MRTSSADKFHGVPVLQSASTPNSGGADPFAFARRLQTATWVFDIDNTCILFANASACKLWHAENEAELQQRELAKDMSPTVADRLKQYQTDFIESDATFHEMWTLYPKGEPQSTMVVFSGLCLPDGRMAMLCEAIGDQIEEPNNLRSAEALLHTDVMISLYEVRGPAVYMNPAARTVSDKMRKSFSEKFVDQNDYCTLMEKLEKSGQHRMVTKVHTANGRRWHDLSVKNCSDAATGNPVILETAIDVSELKNARDTARYLADRDQLTGCYNRTFLAQYVSLFDGHKPTQCAVIAMDVDHFKNINDRFGHDMGDEVLKRIVERASNVIRKDDVIFRLGGDEFVIILEDTADAQSLSSRVDALLRKIAEPMTFVSTKMNISVSMGVTKFRSDNADFAAIMREADIALYASKQAGRNCVTFFDDALGAAETKRVSLETELKQAIINNEFVLHFQPRVDLRTGQVVSAEGLVRWQHPERGLTMPGEFISVCEETGMIEDLGQLVLEMGYAQSLAWQEDGLDIELSLNISPRQFSDNRLLKTLAKFAADPEFRPEKVELEITENVLIGDLNAIEQKLIEISQLGYRIAIDDFGTGFSNLSYISQFPLNCLKIDQSFIDRLPKSGPVISLILTLAKEIGATVVAEGIETLDQLDWLTQHGCEQGQGYFLSRPVSIDDFADVIGRLAASNEEAERKIRLLCAS